MIKIIFFDVDGTLLRLGCKELSDQMVTTLKSLRNKGILLCMATGRGYAFIPRFKGVDFDIYLTFNGSYVRTSEEVIFTNPLSTEDKNQIISNLKNMNRAIAVSNEQFIVTNGTDPDLEQYFAFGNSPMHIVDDFEKYAEQDIYQIMCSAQQGEYAQILKNTQCAQITAWWDRAVDIIPKNCGKGNAVNKVLQYYGFQKEEAMAFGDGKNDIEMLEAVGTGIAMGNANEEVKNHADEICKSVEEDGIYYYCLEKGII